MWHTPAKSQKPNAKSQKPKAKSQKPKAKSQRRGTLKELKKEREETHLGLRSTCESPRASAPWWLFPAAGTERTAGGSAVGSSWTVSSGSRQGGESSGGGNKCRQYFFFFFFFFFERDHARFISSCKSGHIKRTIIIKKRAAVGRGAPACSELPVWRGGAHGTRRWA
jgi:hypothetical protein